MAFKCGSDNTGGGGKVTQTTDGFRDGHRLKGRYSNSDQGIRSFTFNTDGTFQRGGASSGAYRGGEYSSGSTGSGTYDLSGKTLTVTYENGESDEFTIEVFTWNDQPDYSLETPTRLRIGGTTYVNVD